MAQDAFEVADGRRNGAKVCHFSLEQDDLHTEIVVDMDMGGTDHM